MSSSLEKAIAWLGEVRGTRNTDGEEPQILRTVSTGYCTLSSYLGFSPFVNKQSRIIPDYVVEHAETLHQMIRDGKL
jgi:hypothetical protein